MDRPARTGVLVRLHTACGGTEEVVRTMLSNSLEAGANAAGVDLTADEWAAPLHEQSEATLSAGPGPFIVVGTALALGVTAAKWIGWRARGHKR